MVKQGRQKRRLAEGFFLKYMNGKGDMAGRVIRSPKIVIWGLENGDGTHMAG